MIIKGTRLLFEFKGNEALWLFASSQISQYKDEIYMSTKQFGNNFLMYPNDTCPSLGFHNRISFSLFESTTNDLPNMSESSLSRSK